MKLCEGDKEVELNTISNWPLAVDVLCKFGHTYTEIKNAKEFGTLQVNDLEKLILELSTWGIPWKRTKWEV